MNDEKHQYKLLAGMEGSSSKRKYYKEKIKSIAKSEALRKKKMADAFHKHQNSIRDNDDRKQD